jgi:hypothetical protein
MVGVSGLVTMTSAQFTLWLSAYMQGAGKRKITNEDWNTVGMMLKQVSDVPVFGSTVTTGITEPEQ